YEKTNSQEAGRCAADQYPVAELVLPRRDRRRFVFPFGFLQFAHEHGLARWALSLLADGLTLDLEGLAALRARHADPLGRRGQYGRGRLRFRGLRCRGLDGEDRLAADAAGLVNRPIG